MSNGEIIVLTDVAQITCIVQKGLADVVVKASQEAGAQGATVYYARGGGVRERLGILGLAIEAEKEIVTIIVSTDQVDRVFERMYSAGKLATPGMGMIYVTPLEKAATYVPHDIVEKLAKRTTASSAENRDDN
ncbi:MAG: P-II family nitrogen regulator [Alphaproteobacteria bacterium]